MRAIYFFFVLLWATTIIEAQKDSLIHRPFHFSVITPLSTNGWDSYRTTNDYSFSLFYSGTAAITRLELGAFFNHTVDEVKGTQIAGFANIVNGNTEGLQLSGFMNWVRKDMKGLQMSGFLNRARETKGLQMAGFINVSGKLKGLQLGVFNYTDSLEAGAAVGILSFVRQNGYHRMDVWGDELIPVNLAYKVGVRSFYNILGVGYRYNAEDFLYALTYGIGTELPLSKRWTVNPEVLVQGFIDEKSLINEDWHAVYQLRPLFKYHIAEGMQYYFGPSFKIIYEKSEDPYFPKEMNDWVLTHKQTELSQLFYIGVSTGFSFF